MSVASELLYVKQYAVEQPEEICWMQVCDALCEQSDATQGIVMLNVWVVIREHISREVDALISEEMERP